MPSLLIVSWTFDGNDHGWVWRYERWVMGFLTAMDNVGAVDGMDGKMKASAWW